MTTNDYKKLAVIVGETLGTALLHNSPEGYGNNEENRTAIYDSLYRPMVKILQDDNDRFDNLAFASAVAIAEFVLLRNKLGAL